MRGSITAPFLSLRDIYVCQINNCAEREAYKATPPVPTPVPTPTPPPSKSTKVNSVEEVDFANFTYPPVEGCGKRPVSLKMGMYKDKEVRVQLAAWGQRLGKRFSMPILNRRESESSDRATILRYLR